MLLLLLSVLITGRRHMNTKRRIRLSNIAAKWTGRIVLLNVIVENSPGSENTSFLTRNRTVRI